MIGLAVLSYSVDEIMKMYGGIFLYSNPLGSYEQSKFSRLVAKLKLAHRRWAGAKIAFLNDYSRDLVVCHIVRGKLLLPQISIAGFVGLLFSWRCSAIFSF